MTHKPPSPQKQLGRSSESPGELLETLAGFVAPLAHEHLKALASPPSFDLPPILRARLSDPPGRQLVVVRNSSQLRSVENLYRLLAEADRQLVWAPAEGLACSSFALVILAESAAQGSYSSELGDLGATSALQVAEAFRLLDNVAESELAISLSQHLWRFGTRSPLLEGRILTVSGDLRCDARALEEALNLYRRAYEIFKAHEACRGQAVATLTSLGWVRGRQGETAKALRYTSGALELVDPTTQPAEFARSILVHAWFLLEAGEHDLARGHLESLTILGQARMPWGLRLRVHWLGARLQAAGGDPVGATPAMERVLAEIRERGLVTEFAAAARDLLALYLRSGRWQDAMKVQREMSVVTHLDTQFRGSIARYRRSLNQQARWDPNKAALRAAIAAIRSRLRRVGRRF